MTKERQCKLCNTKCDDLDEMYDHLDFHLSDGNRTYQSTSELFDDIEIEGK